MSKLFREGQPSKQLSSLAEAEPELPEQWQRQRQRQRLCLPSLLLSISVAAAEIRLAISQKKKEFKESRGERQQRGQGGGDREGDRGSYSDYTSKQNARNFCVVGVSSLLLFGPGKLKSICATPTSNELPMNECGMEYECGV